MRRLLAGLVLCAATAGAQTQAPAPEAAPQGAAAPAAAPDTVLKLKDGGVLVGNVVSANETTVVFRTLTLGEMSVPIAAIAAKEPVPGAQPAAGGAVPPGVDPAAGGMAPIFQALASGKPIYVRSLTVGGQYTSAPYIQGQLDPAIPQLTGEALRLPGKNYGLQAMGAIYRYTMKDAMSVESGYTYAKAEPIGAQANLLTLDFGYNRRIDDAKYLITRSSYKRDDVRNIDYSLVQLAGVGFKVVNTPRTKFDVAPGGVVAYEKKGSVEFDKDVLFGVGAMETFSHAFNPTFLFEQRALYRVMVGHTEVWALDSYAGFKGMVNPKVGISMGAQYVYDNTLGDRLTPVPANSLFPGSPALNLQANEKGQLMMTAGVQVKF